MRNHTQKAAWHFSYRNTTTKVPAEPLMVQDDILLLFDLLEELGFAHEMCWES
jgi:hypothetical protein